MAGTNMIRMTFKWISRCLGWIVLGCLAMGVMGGYFMDKKIGYGGLEIRLLWRDMIYSLDQQGIASAELEIRGKRQTLEPRTIIRLRPGSASLQLKLRNFHPCSVATNIVKNVKTIVEFRLEAEPRTISILNLVSNAAINGEPCGSTWVLTNAEVGRNYRIEATVPGYHTNVLSLKIENPGDDLVTNLVWRPLIGFVSIRVTPSADGTIVAIDGAPTDLVTGGAVAVGIHSLSASNSDYYPLTQHIEVAYGLTNYCEIVLRPKPASLTVEVAPAVPYRVQDSAGHLVDLNNGMAELPPGTNNLTILAKGYKSQRQEFLMQPNKRYPWKVQLEQEGLQDFNDAKERFETLKTSADLVLLRKYGDGDWEKLDKITPDTEDLFRGARQYNQASTNLTALLEQCKIREERQEAIDRQKREEEAAKQALLDSAKEKANSIEQLLHPVTGDDLTRRINANEARNLVDQYDHDFGEGTQYARFGNVAYQVREWRRIIDIILSH